MALFKWLSNAKSDAEEKVTRIEVCATQAFSSCLKWDGSRHPNQHELDLFRFKGFQ
jgi:hypothetical protein